jgi:flavodoxin
MHHGTMTKALVIYDTTFGNTEKVANALVQGLAAHGIEAESVNVDCVAIDRLSEYDALLVGGPTHRQKMSEPMAMFLDRLDKAHVRGKAGFAFDTKVEHRLAGRCWGTQTAKRDETIDDDRITMRVDSCQLGQPTGYVPLSCQSKFYDYHDYYTFEVYFKNERGAGFDRPIGSMLVKMSDGLIPSILTKERSWAFAGDGYGH